MKVRQLASSNENIQELCADNIVHNKDIRRCDDVDLCNDSKIDQKAIDYSLNTDNIEHEQECFYRIDTRQKAISLSNTYDISFSSRSNAQSLN